MDSSESAARTTSYAPDAAPTPNSWLHSSRREWSARTNSHVSATFVAPLDGKAGPTMAAKDRATNAVQILTGRLKEAVGRATRNPRLKRRGQGDQAVGHLKNAGEAVKDALHD